LTELLSTEWPDGDFRWAEAMTGQYADTLSIAVCAGSGGSVQPP
jgi:hypothetical protein